MERRAKLIKRCTSCKQPVKGHKGQWGPKCAGRSLISFQDEPVDPEEEVWQELMEDEVLQESQEAQKAEEDKEKEGQESQVDETNNSQNPRRYRLFRESRLASTPGQDVSVIEESRMSGIEDLQNGEKGEILKKLVEQISSMQNKMDALASAQASLAAASSSQAVPVYTVAGTAPATLSSVIGGASALGQAVVNTQLRVCSSSMGLANLAAPVVSNGQPISGAAGRISYLKPVLDGVDLSQLDILPRISGHFDEESSSW